MIETLDDTYEFISTEIKLMCYKNFTKKHFCNMTFFL